MKRIFSFTGILVLTSFLLTSFSLFENPQDPPRGEKHIKIVKIDDSGNRVELDTLLTNDEIFVWNGDTIDGGNKLKWIMNDEFSLDSLHKNMNIDFEYEISENEDGNVIIMKSGNKTNPIIHALPHPPAVPNVMFFDNEKSGNIIDLSDPGIISFKKKKMSGGREKITIIRNEKDEKNVKRVEKIIVTKKGVNSPFLVNEPRVHKIIVAKNGDGKIEVFEDEDLLNFGERDGTVKVIQEDGKVIRIKEIKEGNEKKIEVEVEVEEDDNDNN